MSLPSCLFAVMFACPFSIHALWLFPALLAFLLVLLFLLRWIDWAAARRVMAAPTADAAELPRISIIVPCFNAARALETSIPKILQQDYPDFQIILVNENSEDDTADVIKRLAQSDPRVRHTYVPDTSRSIEPRKLALTLGIKAARSEWVVIAEPDAQPVSRSWLRTLATRCTEAVDAVLSLCLVRTNDDEPRSALRRASYECLAEQLRLAAAVRLGNSVGWMPANVCMRKNWFLANDGFTDSLTLPFGEETLLLAAHATRERTAVCLDRAAALTLPAPDRRALAMEHVKACETGRRAGRRARLYRLRETAAAWTHLLAMLVPVVYLALRLAVDLSRNAYTAAALAPDIIVLLLTAALLLLPPLLLRPVFKRLQQPVPWLYATGHALLCPWRRTAVAVRCKWLRKTFVRRF
ncbi:MAG: glycosyltransferase [Alloprevotella sp.]